MLTALHVLELAHFPWPSQHFPPLRASKQNGGPTIKPNILQALLWGFIKGFLTHGNPNTDKQPHGHSWRFVFHMILNCWGHISCKRFSTRGKSIGPTPWSLSSWTPSIPACVGRRFKASRLGLRGSDFFFFFCLGCCSGAQLYLPQSLNPNCLLHAHVVVTSLNFLNSNVSFACVCMLRMYIKVWDFSYGGITLTLGFGYCPTE